jgi:hypothetical protein
MLRSFIQLLVNVNHFTQLYSVDILRFVKCNIHTKLPVVLYGYETWSFAIKGGTYTEGV